MRVGTGRRGEERKIEGEEASFKYLKSYDACCEHIESRGEDRRGVMRTEESRREQKKRRGKDRWGCADSCMRGYFYSQCLL